MVAKLKKEIKDEVMDALCLPGIERACIGGLIINSELFYEIEDDFPEDAFSDKNWRIMFRLLRSLHNSGQKISKDSIIVQAEKIPEASEMLLAEDGIKLLESAMRIPDIANFHSHLKELKDLFNKRTLLKDKREEIAYLENKISDRDYSISEIIDDLDKKSSEINVKVKDLNEYVSVGSACSEEEFIKRSEDKINQGIGLGIPTNMKPWDDMLGGLIGGRLYVLGAPTGCGKSILTTAIAAESAYGGERRTKHLVIDTGELIYEDDFEPRLLANLSGVPTNLIANGSYVKNEFYKKRVRDAWKKMNNDPCIFWTQMHDFDGTKIKSLIKRMIHKEGIESVFFDLIKINSNWKISERYEKIADLAQYLKDAAVTLNIPVWANIQLTSDSKVVGMKKLGMKSLHVDMFAGGTKTLQQTDVGLILDFANRENQRDNNRKLIVGKGRSLEIHGEGEYIDIQGNLACSRMEMVQNVLLNEDFGSEPEIDYSSMPGIDD